MLDIVNICPNCGLGTLSNASSIATCPECGHNLINLAYKDIARRIVVTIESKKRLKAKAEGTPLTKLHYPLGLG